MTVADVPVTISLPRSILEQVANLSPLLTVKLHTLLERNADGVLNADEKNELETLVQISQFNQIVALALEASKHH